MQGQIIGGWDALENNEEIGKCIELHVTQQQGKQGGFYNVFDIFQRYTLREGAEAGKVAKGRSFSLNKKNINQVVKLMNFLIANFMPETERGEFIYQAQAPFQPQPGIAYAAQNPQYSSVLTPSQQNATYVNPNYQQNTQQAPVFNPGTPQAQPPQPSQWASGGFQGRG